MKPVRVLLMLSLPGLFPGSVDAGEPRRLPPGYHQGRCLYIVGGKHRIAGRCLYKIHKGGAFHIDGPRQAFGGVDTVDRGSSALTYSRDWWADVFPDEGGWSGYGNESVKNVHGGRTWSLRREGACFVGEAVKICLWRE
jgi:hypothetical protein